ncbi:MAG: ribonuclease III [Patescibacteria group bacterium]|mgnify:CR=1 FL=1
MPVDFSSFETKVSITFTNKAILRQAFTHRSYLNEHRTVKTGHNERLEFLGDAVLELAVTAFLYDKFPGKTEGDLTSYRAALVNANTLGEVAQKLGMDKYLLLSKGEAKDKGRARLYILANTFEALIGAVFLDQGYTAAEKFIAEHVLPLTEEVVSKKLWLDAKSHFQEKAQDEFSQTPSYKTVSEEGPDHDKNFTIAVYIGKEKIAEGKGRSKQDAEQSAAQEALKKKNWL